MVKAQSLKEVSKTAESLREQYRKYSADVKHNMFETMFTLHFVRTDEREIAEVNTFESDAEREKYRVYTESRTAFLESNRDTYMQQADKLLAEASLSQERVKHCEKYAAEHYAENEAAYFEIALLEAHLDGVAINVEQPLVVGQKVEAHSSQQ